jgi:hypothetical protein
LLLRSFISLFCFFSDFLNMISSFSNKQRLVIHLHLKEFWLLQTSSIYIFNIVCPYIADWSMRDEMSGMPKNTFDAIQVIVRYVSHSVQCGISNMWHCNAILTNLDPFHTIEQKRHSTFDGHRFIRKTFYDTSIIISPNGIFLQLLPINKFHKTK